MADVGGTGGKRAGHAFKSLAKASPTHQIREQLLTEIMNGTYKPGETLPSERALCEMFDVSRVSVREAIAGLEAIGVVIVKHGRGCFVAEAAGESFSEPFGSWLRVHHDQMIELLRVRGALDELAASEMARHHDPKALKALEIGHKRYAAVVERRGQSSLADLVELDAQFHATIARGSASKLLGDLLGELSTHIADSRRLTFLGEGQPQRSLHEHQQITDAIRAGDADQARLQAGRHIVSVREWLEQHP